MTAYIYLFCAVIFGTASNSFAKNADGFSKLIPSLLSIITIILCMFCLSQVMKSIPIGITYASFAGLCIIATVLIGIIKFNQIPNILFICWFSFNYYRSAYHKLIRQNK